MFTVNFVDNTHLLLTFHTHGLIPRLPDEPPDDNDRLVNALLLELPSGKVVARTQWHTHDHQQYLWPLSNGMFLLRIRSKLSVIDPLRHLNTSEPFRQQAFLSMNRPIGYIAVSPGGDLVTVETVPPIVHDGDDMGLGGAEAHPRLTDFTEIHFFRLVTAEQPGEPAHLVAQAAGLVRARGLTRLPVDADGFLDISQESPQTWLFDFQSHAGKRLELAPFDTTCAPIPYFTSRSDFVAFGCHGERLELGGFNFRGEEPWVQMLGTQQIAPYITSAPGAGRVAFSHINVSASFYDLQNLLPEELSGQEIQILQNYDGRILLKVQASPIQRAGQNYDLSSDGQSFTVIRNGNLEVYRLPALTPKDQEQLARSAADAPEKNDVRISLASPKHPEAPAADTVTAKAPAFTVAPGTQPAPQPAPAPNKEEVPNNPDEPSAKPSLYSPDYPKKPPTL
jgi:hypothetical protein